MNPSDENETVTNNMFNVPEVESPMVKRIFPKTSSTQKKSTTKQDKKTVQIHTLASKIQKTKLVGTFTCFNLFIKIFSRILVFTHIYISK